MTENAAYLQLITSHQISVLFRLINTYYHLHMYVYHVTINLDISLVCFFVYAIVHIRIFLQQTSMFFVIAR